MVSRHDGVNGPSCTFIAVRPGALDLRRWRSSSGRLEGDDQPRMARAIGIVDRIETAVVVAPIVVVVKRVLHPDPGAADSVETGQGS